MKKSRIRRPAAIAIMALASGIAAAQSPTFNFSGFGTLGATVTDTDIVQLRTTLEDNKGATKSADVGFESRIAGQAQVRFGNDVSFMGQAMAIRRVDKEMKPDIEWLFAQYSGIKDTDLRVGRMVLPAFMVSDSRFVGYSIPWARVPVLVYATLPMSTVDGVQIAHRQTFGDTVVSGQFSAGKNDRGTSEISKIRSGNLTVESGDWTGRVALTHSKVRFFDGPILPFKDKFLDFGVQYDNGKWFASAEYVRRRTSTQVFDSHSYSAGGGVRYGQWAPYILLSKFAGEDSVQPAFTVTVPFPPFQIPVKLITPDSATTGTAVGVRYDVAKNLAVKAELARYKGRNPLIFRDATGAAASLPADFVKPVTALSINLDFVF